jgi:hypothetical protein
MTKRAKWLFREIPKQLLKRLAAATALFVCGNLHFNWNIVEISGSHDCKYEDGCLL